ncbi:DoxX family membrane protein [Fibrella aquatilis]|uniref:DoxX family membrane protein n=1 Tax=Fibrella aquatilis TaxID=2817059 RepID=A0A939JV37_9BACT|nr:DoxX family membrane protein [Fibrella aquatilis]MBO0930442.1 DoxX family membrane protein [Fibrella aquatilis]
MNTYAKTGQKLFALTFIMGGLLHITGPTFTVQQVPTFFPAPLFWVYLTGIGQLCFAVSILIERFDKLAALLLALMMIVFIATMHVPKAVAGDFMGVISAMRDMGYAGAALLYAGAIAKDNRIIG